MPPLVIPQLLIIGFNNAAAEIPKITNEILFPSNNVAIKCDSFL